MNNCGKCGKGFHNKSNFNRHIKRFHPIEDDLDYHKTDASDNYEDGDMCSTTEADASGSDDTESEKDSRKRANRAFCNNCRKNFSNNSNLYRHIKSVHCDKKESGYEANEDMQPVTNKTCGTYCKMKEGKKCKDKANVKRQILNHYFSIINASKKASRSLKKIEKLLRIL